MPKVVKMDFIAVQSVTGVLYRFPAYAAIWRAAYRYCYSLYIAVAQIVNMAENEKKNPQGKVTLRI